MVNGQKYFDQPVKNSLKRHYNSQIISNGQRNGYTTGCLLDYHYLKNILRWQQQISLKNSHMTLIQKQ